MQGWIPVVVYREHGKLQETTEIYGKHNVKGSRDNLTLTGYTEGKRFICLTISTEWMTENVVVAMSYKLNRPKRSCG